MSTCGSNKGASLAAMLCLAAGLAVKATEAADLSGAAQSRGSRGQPRLAEQDVWRRWQRAHNACSSSVRSKSTAAAPARAHPRAELAEQDIWKRWERGREARKSSRNTRLTNAAEYTNPPEMKRPSGSVEPGRTAPAPQAGN